MARSKPNETLYSPHTQQIEEQNKQDKTDTSTNITPHATKTSKRTTGTEERSEKRNITQKKYIRYPETIPYCEGDSLDQKINRNDGNKKQSDEAGDVVKSCDDSFMQPPDEEPQCNILTEEEQAIIKAELQTKKTQNQRPNRKMKIVPCCLNRIEEDSINKNMKVIT
jgi:hypothetical protein